MLQQLKWWWESIEDWLDRAVEYLDSNRLKIALVVVMILGALSGISLLLDSITPAVIIESRQIGDQIMLSWEAPPAGALVYQIQGRQWGEGWTSFAWSPFPFFHLAIPPGAVEFRVRPWTKDGPGKWSRPSEIFIHVLLPDIFNEEEEEMVKPAKI